MEQIIENINRVLADWNPIDVPENIAIDEYKRYVPLILKSVENRQHLINCLEDILINRIGVDYDPTDKEHLEDLQQVCDKLIQAYQKIEE